MEEILDKVLKLLLPWCQCMKPEEICHWAHIRYETCTVHVYNLHQKKLWRHDTYCSTSNILTKKSRSKMKVKYYEWKDQSNHIPSLLGVVFSWGVVYQEVSWVCSTLADQHYSYKTFGKHFTLRNENKKPFSQIFTPNPHPSYHHPSFLNMPFDVNNNFTNSQALPKLPNATSP